jgi:hypothetical protein
MAGTAGRLDQGHAQRMFGGQHAGHQPAGGTAADHHDVFDRVIHRLSLTQKLYVEARLCPKNNMDYKKTRPGFPGRAHSFTRNDQNL